MSDLLLDEQSAPVTPASGQAIAFFDTNGGLLAAKNEAGRIQAFSYNAAIAAQAGGFAADTYLTDSDLLIPSWGFQARTVIRWRMSASKTGAGVAQPIYTIRTGANRTTGDTSRLVLTGPAQTAIADIGTLDLMLSVRSVGSSGVLAGTAWWTHRGTAANTTTSGTGFANDSTGHVEGNATFDMTALAGAYIGLSINGGTNAVWSPTQVQAEAWW